MRVAVMYAPGDVRVEDRPEPKILEADRCGHSPGGDLHLRVGPVALPRGRASWTGPARWVTSTPASWNRSATGSARSSRVSSWSVVLRLRQHL